MDPSYPGVVRSADFFSVETTVTAPSLVDTVVVKEDNRADMGIKDIKDINRNLVTKRHHRDSMRADIMRSGMRGAMEARNENTATHISENTEGMTTVVIRGAMATADTVIIILITILITIPTTIPTTILTTVATGRHHHLILKLKQRLNPLGIQST